MAGLPLSVCRRAAALAAQMKGKVQRQPGTAPPATRQQPAAGADDEAASQQQQQQSSDAHVVQLCRQVCERLQQLKASPQPGVLSELQGLQQQAASML
jgi:hypothetical protein